MDDYCVGIDLGTMNSVLAYLDGNGDPEVDKGQDGSVVVPSSILFTDMGKIIGSKAEAQARIEGYSNFSSGFKRQMGTKYTRTIMSSTYTPTEMSALVLRKMLLRFEANHGAMPTKAVLSVPGDYGVPERQATIQAGRIAGLEAIELINEPTAACISYCRENRFREGNLIIFDLGGGTFDASVIKVSNNKFSVLANEGSRNLGGKDWNLHLANIIQRKIIDAYGMTQKEADRNSKMRRDIAAEARRVKELLTVRNRVTDTININGMPVTYTVRREEFEDATHELNLRLTTMMLNAVRSAGLRERDISKVVMTGGESQISAMMRYVDDALPTVRTDIYEPFTSMAKGSALYADSVFSDGNIVVEPVLSKTLGIKAGVDGNETIYNVVFRSTPLPITPEAVFRPKRDDQKTLELEVYETKANPGTYYTGLPYGFMIKRFEIPLPGKISRGRTKINVRFAADVNGLIQMFVECNGHAIECDMSNGMNMLPAQIMQSKKKVVNVI
ncbi:MAG: Hsp70 family protein [Candidatus Methanomethylophilaceae archaeon]